MITFTKPENLNGTELRSELNTAGVVISNAPESVAIDENGNLVLDINSNDEAKAKKIVDAHNGTTVAPEPTIADKLASVGLSIEELKTALGGN
jgi:hypothetical protein